MSRAWIAFYMGDYDKDTQALSTLEHGAYFLLLKQCWVHGSIPLEPRSRANICKMTLKEWGKVEHALAPFFDSEGRNKRATAEIEKAEIIRLRRAMAGQRGGYASGISKAKQMNSNRVAIAKQTYKQNTKPSVPNHNSKIITTTESVERGESGSAIRASPELLATLTKGSR